MCWKTSSDASDRRGPGVSRRPLHGWRRRVVDRAHAPGPWAAIAPMNAAPPDGTAQLSANAFESSRPFLLRRRRPRVFAPPGRGAEGTGDQRRVPRISERPPCQLGLSDVSVARAVSAKPVPRSRPLLEQPLQVQPRLLGAPGPAHAREAGFDRRALRRPESD